MAAASTMPSPTRRSPTSVSSSLTVLFLLSSLILDTAAFVVIPWSTRTYGFDGPWQAISANVGGFTNGQQPSSQWTAVDLLPGGTWSSYIPSAQLCSQNISGICGLGGTWRPATGTGATISFQPSTGSNGYFLKGPAQIQYLNVGGVGTPQQAVTVPNATLVSVTNGSVILPSGATTDLELGTFSLGADAQVQQFSTGGAPIQGWTMAGWLFNTSQTQSYSYGLQIGSVAFNYPGSLIFGGWDKGRAIGPGTTFGATAPQLLDISLGVETGASPFASNLTLPKSGLLQSNSGSAVTLSARPDPLVPYLYLPQGTCSALAARLPVTYDASSGYYFWNTSDPAYRRITASPAWLGFTFPPAPGNTANVLIKVPFALLTLNLTRPAISGGLQPYFPCMPYTPPAATAGAAAGTADYVLGRAFLQAAFLGRNWNTKVSWLAQAPGPGAANAGLGYEGTDLRDGDTTLPYYNNTALFNQSWTGWWSPVVAEEGTGQAGTGATGTGATGTGNGQGSNGASAGGGLSAAAGAGIGVGVGILLLGLLAAGAWWFVARRRKQQQRQQQTAAAGAAGANSANPYSDHPGSGAAGAGAGHHEHYAPPAQEKFSGQVYEAGPGTQVYEKYAPVPTVAPVGRPPAEMEGGRAVHELEGGRVELQGSGR